MKYIAALLLCSFLLPAANYYQTGQAARLVIGQSNFTAQANDVPSANRLGAAGGVAYVNNTLFVVDSNRIQASPVLNRVLIYNNIHNFVTPPEAEIQQGVRCPVCGGTANVVLGQPDFITSPVALTFPLPPPTPSSLRTPTAVASDGVRLVIADTDNNRILIWNSIPTTNNAPANVVVGQADFVTVKSLVLDNKSFRGPQGVDGTAVPGADRRARHANSG